MSLLPGVARWAGVAAVALLTAACSESKPALQKGDPQRGEKIHAVCLDCHGTGLYTSADRKIKSLKALRKEVVRWGDYYNPALTEQEAEDVLAYLNTQFYKF
jgi:mono/diheme cytochrome c family protein